MAAVSSSKWTSFYNDPPPSDYNEEEDTSTGQLPPFISYSISCLLKSCLSFLASKMRIV